MKWKNLINWHVLRHWFDWTPTDVQVPQPRYEVYKDAGRVLLGYEVQITYRHHGVYTLLFPTTDNLGEVGRRRALYRAIKFYKSTRNNIRATINSRNENIK